MKHHLMSEPSAVAQRERAHAHGLIFGLLTFPFRLFGMLCGSLLLSILIECIGMYFFWPAESWHHAQDMLEHELNHLATYFTQSLLVRQPSGAAQRLVDLTFDHLLVKTGALDWIHNTSARSHANARQSTGFQHLAGLVYVNIEAYALAAGYTCLTFLVRLLVLLLTLPLFLMAALVGVVDGLVRRDVRRFSSGRESGFLYHRARASVVPLAVFPWVAYLALPVSVHPLLILLPAATLLSIAVNLTVGSFKKYL
jgi:integrating conjugative element membrane protein (TIGR03747 family)